MIPLQVAQILEMLVIAFRKGVNRGINNLDTSQDAVEKLLMKDAWLLYEQLSAEDAERIEPQGRPLETLPADLQEVVDLFEKPYEMQWELEQRTEGFGQKWLVANGEQKYRVVEVFPPLTDAEPAPWSVKRLGAGQTGKIYYAQNKAEIEKLITDGGMQ